MATLKMKITSAVFKSYRDRMTEKERKKFIENTVDMLKSNSKKYEDIILNAWPLPILSIDFESPVWSKIQEYHRCHYDYYFIHNDDRMFIYHLGLANLAEHISEVKVENKEAFQQHLVYLQFGKDYPDIFNSFHQTISYQKSNKCGKDFLIEIKDLIICYGKNESLPGIDITYEEWESLMNQYIDGCIRMLANLTNPYAYNDGVVFDSIPKVFDVKRNRDKTLGDFFDDYLSKVDPTKNL